MKDARLIFLLACAFLLGGISSLTIDRESLCQSLCGCSLEMVEDIWYDEGSGITYWWDGEDWIMIDSEAIDRQILWANW